MPPIVDPMIGIRSNSATSMPSSSAYGMPKASAQTHVPMPAMNDVSRLPST